MKTLYSPDERYIADTLIDTVPSRMSELNINTPYEIGLFIDDGWSQWTRGQRGLYFFVFNSLVKNGYLPLIDCGEGPNGEPRYKFKQHIEGNLERPPGGAPKGQYSPIPSGDWEDSGSSATIKISITQETIERSLICPNNFHRAAIYDTEFPGLYIECEANTPGLGWYFFEYTNSSGATSITRIGQTNEFSIVQARKVAELLAILKYASPKESA